MKDKGLLIVYTGKGKGKTTAALGLMLRAVGHSMPVCVIQFLKGSWAYGELPAVARFDDLIDFHVLGKGFTWKSEDLAEDTRVAREAWAFAQDILRQDRHRLVILDELTYLVKYNMVDEASILAALRDRPDAMHVVVTGREASAGLVGLADLVTEMREVKHPFHDGLKAQRGIEF